MIVRKGARGTISFRVWYSEVMILMVLMRRTTAIREVGVYKKKGKRASVWAKDRGIPREKADT